MALREWCRRRKLLWLVLRLLRLRLVLRRLRLRLLERLLVVRGHLRVPVRWVTIISSLLCLSKLRRNVVRKNVPAQRRG